MDRGIEYGYVALETRGGMNHAATSNTIAKGLPLPDRALARERHTFEAAAIGVALVVLVVWLPLQTPVAIVAHQYLGLSGSATRVLLLAKDVFTLGLALYLAVRYVRTMRWRWFDYLALAYAVVLAAYALFPTLLGTGVSIAATAASVRQFILPIELYAVGRLAVASGVNVRIVMAGFVAVSMVAAVFTIGTYVLLPIEFWASTLDLVTFVREVQGIPTAEDLLDISLLGTYGLDEPVPRAVGPFTHPVGTGIYFVMPLMLAVAATFAGIRRGATRAALGWAAAALVFAVALIIPLSRGSWIAAGIGLLICGLWLRQVRIAMAAAVATGAFLFFVPPFSDSVHSALSLRDYSTLGHQEAVERGVDTVVDNPLGLGVGHGDTGFNRAFDEAGQASADVGENMYLALLVSVGPVGALAFVLWMIGLIVFLLRGPPRLWTDWSAVAGGAVLVGVAVASLTSSPLMRFTTAASLWLVIGLIVGLMVVADVGSEAGHPAE